jgi:hypothetical protein
MLTVKGNEITLYATEIFKMVFIVLYELPTVLLGKTIVDQIMKNFLFETKTN